MRVRCSFCGAEYEAAVTRAALVLVDRCERCGRARLRSAEADPPGRAAQGGPGEASGRDQPDPAA
jgi:hypothetical protein